MLFAVFALVDWRGNVARGTASAGAALPALDRHAFADAWRAEHQRALTRVRDSAALDPRAAAGYGKKPSTPQ